MAQAGAEHDCLASLEGIDDKWESEQSFWVVIMRDGGQMQLQVNLSTSWWDNGCTSARFPEAYGAFFAAEVTPADLLCSLAPE